MDAETLSCLCGTCTAQYTFITEHPSLTERSLRYKPNLPSVFEAQSLTLFSDQQQIDDTVNVMKKNLESVAQRGEHIDQLQDKSENLNQSAQGFRRGANRVRKQMWWKNMKMRIWIIVGIIVLLIIIIIPSGEYPGLWSFNSRG